MLVWRECDYTALTVFVLTRYVQWVSVEKLVPSLSLSKMITTDLFREKELSVTGNTLVALDLTQQPLLVS